MLIPAMSGGRYVFPMPQGVMTIAAADFSSNVCTLKMNPTDETGEKQLTAHMVTVVASASNDDLVLPPVKQCDGLVLYIINASSSNNIDLKYVDSSGSVEELDLAASEIGICMCDGARWFALVSTAS